MIKLIFSIRNQLLALVIKGKEIFCTDKNNRIPKKYIPETEEDKIELDNAKSEEELSIICEKHCKKIGSILLKKEII